MSLQRYALSTRHPFRPGDQIICIDASPSRWSNAAPVLEAGAAYTVERTGNKPAGRGGPISAGVHVAEARFADPDHGWLASRFRSVADWEAER